SSLHQDHGRNPTRWDTRDRVTMSPVSAAPGLGVRGNSGVAPVKPLVASGRRNPELPETAGQRRVLPPAPAVRPGT
ncbi:MAG TPA: hypothetical protein VGR16_12580, partial [Thermomicrobiales bacterium]|nr:hypothetical protein [Thermomicrobiales bacterium]